jgi:hypothetical protein
MDTLFATIAGVFIANLTIVIPLFFWNRSESRSDVRMMLGLIDGIQKEMKDFHGRLCAIEEARKK